MRITSLIKRFNYALATFLFVATTGVTSLAPVYAGGNTKPGNNGTVKINDLDADDSDSSTANDPHVDCSFAVNFYNYDATQIDATVSFELKSPTSGIGYSLTVDSGDLTPSFVSTGGSKLDYTENYTLSFTGAAQVNQGYHVKMEVDAPYSQGSDKKFKTFWVGPCVAPTKTATPTSPAATVPDCDTQTMTITLPNPSDEGVIWTPNGTTTLQPGESITYTATADTGYTLDASAKATYTFTNTFDTASCVQASKTATPTEPTIIPPTCENLSIIVTPAGDEGVVWTPSGPTTLQPGESITYKASPANGYVFANNAQTDFYVMNDFGPEGCGNGDNMSQNPVVTAAPDACVPTALPTGEVTVTVHNPNATTETYTVELDGQDSRVMVPAGGSKDVHFSGLAVGTYTVEVTSGDDTNATTTVTLVACPPITPITPPAAGNGQVLGESTMAPATSTAAAQLANTGMSVVVPTILAVSLTLSATGVMFGSYMQRKRATSDLSL